MKKLIKSIRRKHGLTQSQVCCAIGVSQSLLSQVETGKIPVTVSLALRIKRRLRLSAKEQKSIDLYIEGKS